MRRRGRVGLAIGALTAAFRGGVVRDLQQHAALAQRIVWYAPMVAKTDPQFFGAMLDHGLTAAAAPPDLIISDARDLILRVSRGIPRLIRHLLRISLVLADERGLLWAAHRVMYAASYGPGRGVPPGCPRPRDRHR